MFGFLVIWILCNQRLGSESGMGLGATVEYSLGFSKRYMMCNIRRLK